MKAELRRGALAGVQSPEVDGQMPRHGDDGFLARCAGAARAFDQDAKSLSHGRVSGLEAHEPPCELD